MPISIQDVVDEAVTDLFVDDGGVSDFITPSAQARAINTALQEWWEAVVEMNLNLYAFRNKTLSIVAGTSEYALDTDVERVTGMWIREGTSPYYTYNEIPPFQDSRNHFNNQGSGSRIGSPTDYLGSAHFCWMESKQALDANGYWVRYVTFSGVPAAAYTAVYDGLRRITRVSVPAAGASFSSPTTTYLDIPESARRIIVLHMVKYFNMRNKSNWEEINRELSIAYSKAASLHRRGIQWQAPLAIVRTE